MICEHVQCKEFHSPGSGLRASYKDRQRHLVTSVMKGIATQIYFGPRAIRIVLPGRNGYGGSYHITLGYKLFFMVVISILI